MDTRRFRYHSQSVAAFRWLGWVMLMMFVLVQAVRADEPAQASAPLAATQANVP